MVLIPLAAHQTGESSSLLEPQGDALNAVGDASFALRRVTVPQPPNPPTNRPVFCCKVIALRNSLRHHPRQLFSNLPQSKLPILVGRSTQPASTFTLLPVARIHFLQITNFLR